jgi:hypothetical protein
MKEIILKSADNCKAVTVNGTDCRMRLYRARGHYHAGSGASS